MRKDDAIRLQHMLDAALEAKEFAKGRNRADLDGDRMLVLSLVKDIEIIGEAGYQISDVTRNQLPTIPWEISLGCVTAWSTPSLTTAWMSLCRLCKRIFGRS